MKITKFGHCCLLIETKKARIVTDPGCYNKTPSLKHIDAILITHEHQDHLHIPALKKILKTNKDALVVSHKSVGTILEKENIPYFLLKDKETISIHGIPVTSFGTKHACIHHELPLVQNTGYLINKTLYYPGDALHVPQAPVKILALPVAGPWLKIEDAIEFAKKVKPKIVFPVHDGMLRQGIELGPTRRLPTTLLSKHRIKFIDMGEGDTKEF